MTNLTLHILQYVFPSDTVWSFNGAEIVGYSISKNLHFVIEDGMCISEDDTYLLRELNLDIPRLMRSVVMF